MLCNIFLHSPWIKMINIFLLSMFFALCSKYVNSAWIMWMHIFVLFYFIAQLSDEKNFLSFLRLPFLCIYCYHRPSRSRSINTTKVHLIPLYLYHFITYFFIRILFVLLAEWLHEGNSSNLYRNCLIFQ